MTLRGKRLGFSLAEIRELFDLYDTDKTSRTQLHSMIQIIEARRHSLRQQLEDIQMVMAELEVAEQRCVNSLNALKTGAE
ncbi:MerR, DNA binding [compost metagenome]